MAAGPNFLIQDNTTSSAVSWRSSPDVRGTFDILSISLSTLFICVWSSVNLDIPTRPNSWQEKSLAKIGWLLCGVFVPELFCFLVWNQLFAACALVYCLYRDHDLPSPPDSWYNRLLLRDLKRNMDPEVCKLSFIRWIMISYTESIVCLHNEFYHRLPHLSKAKASLDAYTFILHRDGWVRI
jgi:hypothetical protein